MNRASLTSPNPLLSTLLALAIGVVIAAVVACGGAPSKTGVRSPVPPSDAGSALPIGKHDQRIVDLDHKIDADFAKLDVGARPQPPQQVTCPAPPCVEPAVAVVMRVKPADDPECKHGDGQVCRETCTLADSICDNGKKICEIAKELPGDTWAEGKCSEGETSCETASKKCCGCQ